MPLSSGEDSQLRKTNYVEGAVSHTTIDTTLYTVTEGKTLYITDISLSGFNTDTTIAGKIEIKDGNTVKVPISSPAAGLGAVASATILNNASISFISPKKFTTNFNVTIVSGRITYSCSFTGYEE